MARCSLPEFNETRNDSERESFLSFEDFPRQSPLKSSIHAGKLRQQLRFTGRSEAIAFLEIIRLVQDKRSKCLHIVLVYGSTAVIKTTAETKLHSESVKFIEVQKDKIKIER